MKILATGKWNLPWTFKTNCGLQACCAQIEVEEEDVKAGGYKDQPWFYYVCGVCGHKTQIPNEEIPLRIRESLASHLKGRPAYYDRD